MSSVTGGRVKLSVFGESHGSAVGCVIDGLPAGVKLDFEKIYIDMARRAPGRDITSTPRLEKDIPEVLSGLLDGVTTGAPLAMIIKNENVKSADYKRVSDVFRPSHSDYTAYIKYGGYNDIRGGGHFSGRLTAPLVFAGAVAKQILSEKGITIGAHIKRIGGVTDGGFDYNNIEAALLESLAQSTFPVIDASAGEAMRAEIERYRADNNSIGGEIECAAVGVPAGLGGNMFDTLESRLSSMLFAIPAVKGVQFGLGFGFAQADAASVNDGYRIEDGEIKLITNNCGGILGGISSGAPLVLSAAFKPTPSIAKKQRSVNIKTMENETLEIKGRHDPCVVLRAVPAVEAAVALVLLDLILQ